MTGIYKIQSITKPERIYIGSAVNYEGRKSVHLHKLRTNAHHSKKLQNHFNKYGEEDLVFSIVRQCDRNELESIEQHLITNLNPWFNICPVVGTTLGATWALSEQARKNISEGHKGMKHSDESKKKRSDKLKGHQPSELARQRSSETHKGQVLNERQLEALRTARTNNQHAKGKHWKLSEETKARMRAAALKNNNASRFKKKTA